MHVVQQNEEAQASMATARYIVFICLLLSAGSAWALQPAGRMYIDTPMARPHTVFAFDLGPIDRPPAKQSSQTATLVESFTLPQVTSKIAEWIGWAANAIKAGLPEHTFDLTPDPIVTAKTRPISLFNPDYGLQGFMKQQWVTPRIGIAAGLGIDLNDEPGQENDDFSLAELRDDLLFGMGLMVAF